MIFFIDFIRFPTVFFLRISLKDWLQKIIYWLSAWVTWLEWPKGVNKEVRRPEGPLEFFCQGIFDKNIWGAKHHIRSNAPGRPWSCHPQFFGGTCQNQTCLAVTRNKVSRVLKVKWEPVRKMKLKTSCWASDLVAFQLLTGAPPAYPRSENLPGPTNL